MSQSIKLPCLRGRMGEWIYYVSLVKFTELAKRTSMVQEIHKNKELSRWIQREVSDRSGDIVAYLKEQPEHFFNSIICGIYGGKPKWQEIDVDEDNSQLTEEESDYFGKTFGILNLSGTEKIFAIDGQHRTAAIKQYVKEYDDLNENEIPVIFLAHEDSLDGEVRTRRLFSTLNRYAVPVSISEIIALDEDDNCAILTRDLIENVDFFKDKIKFSKTRSISPKESKSFTNIVLLYDIIAIIITNKSYSANVKLNGYDFKKFTTKRLDEEILKQNLKTVDEFIQLVIKTIPSLKTFFNGGNHVNRQDYGTNLIFRPIGQIVIFYFLKIAKQHNRFKKALQYLELDTFNLNNSSWHNVFIDKESATLKTDKARQILAIQLMLKRIKIPITSTKKETEFMINFGIDIKDI